MRSAAYLLCFIVALATAETLSPIRVVRPEGSFVVPGVLAASSTLGLTVEGVLYVPPVESIKGCNLIALNNSHPSVWLLENGGCNLDVKLRNAKASSASAVIIYASEQEVDPGALDVAFTVSPMLVAFVSTSQAELVRNMHIAGNATIIAVDSLFGLWEKTSRCATNNVLRASLAGCLLQYQRNVRQHFQAAHACDLAAMDAQDLQRCVRSVDDICIDGIVSDCQAKQLTDSFGFEPFRKNWCYPLPYSCSLLWANLDSSHYLVRDPYQHRMQTSIGRNIAMECDPDAFYDLAFPLYKQWGYEWRWDSSAFQSIPACAVPHYAEYIRSIRDYVMNSESDFKLFCRTAYIDFYRKLFRCFSTQCQRNMRYRCTTGSHSSLEAFATYYFREKCGFESCEEILGVAALHQPNEYACKVENLWAIIHQYHPWPDYICAFTEQLYAALALGVFFGVLLFNSGRLRDILFIILLGIFGVFGLQAILYNGFENHTSTNVAEDQGYNYTQAASNGCLTIIITYISLRVVGIMFGRVKVYDVVYREECLINSWIALFTCAIISWRWDIGKGSEYPQSQTLRSCFAKAKQAGYRYVMVDVVTLDQDAIDAAEVLAFMTSYGKHPVIVGVDSDTIAEYQTRFWCNVEMIIYSKSCRPVYLLDDSEKPTTFRDLHSILTSDDVRATVSLDRLRVFLLLVPFGEALLQLPLDEIAFSQLTLRLDLPNESIVELINWAEQVNDLMITRMLIGDAGALSSFNPLIFWYNHVIWFLLLVIPTNVWFTYSLPTLGFNRLYRKCCCREPSEDGNSSLIYSAGATDDTYLKVFGIIHPLLFGLIVGLGQSSAIPWLFSLFILPLLVRGSLTFILGFHLRSKIRHELMYKSQIIPFPVPVKNNSFVPLRTRIKTALMESYAATKTCLRRNRYRRADQHDQESNVQAIEMDLLQENA